MLEAMQKVEAARKDTICLIMNSNGAGRIARYTANDVIYDTIKEFSSLEELNEWMSSNQN